MPQSITNRAKDSLSTTCSTARSDVHRASSFQVTGSGLLAFSFRDFPLLLATSSYWLFSLKDNGSRPLALACQELAEVDDNKNMLALLAIPPQMWNIVCAL